MPQALRDLRRLQQGELVLPGPWSSGVTLSFEQP